MLWALTVSRGISTSLWIVLDPISPHRATFAAVLARAWKKRVKGRDWYDFASFVARRTPVSLVHLEARLRQGEFFQSADALSWP